MNKSKAIKLKCLDCAGDSPKEVTLCHIVDCSLWPFRFGYSMKDKRYMKRIEAAKRRYPEEYQEMVWARSDYIEYRQNLPENEQIRDVLKRYPHIWNRSLHEEDISKNDTYMQYLEIPN